MTERLVADVVTPHPFNTPEWHERMRFAWRVEENQAWNTKRLYYASDGYYTFEDTIPTASLEALCRAHNDCVLAMYANNSELRRRIQNILNAWRPSLRKLTWWRYARKSVAMDYENTVEIADNLGALRKLLAERITIPEHLLQ